MPAGTIERDRPNLLVEMEELDLAAQQRATVRELDRGFAARALRPGRRYINFVLFTSSFPYLGKLLLIELSVAYVHAMFTAVARHSEAARQADGPCLLLCGWCAFRRCWPGRRGRCSCPPSAASSPTWSTRRHASGW